MEMEQRSIEKLEKYYKAINFIFYAGLVLGILLLIGCLVVTVLAQANGLLNLRENTSYNLRAPGFKVVLDGDYVETSVLVIMLYASVIFWGLILYLLGQLKGIVYRSLKEKTPFSVYNVKAVKNVAYSLFVYAVIFPLFELVISFMFDSDKVFQYFNQLQGIKVYNTITIQKWPILLGLFILILAEIFRHGMQLQQDSDSIV